MRNIATSLGLARSFASVGFYPEIRRNPCSIVIAGSERLPVHINDRHRVIDIAGTNTGIIFHWTELQSHALQSEPPELPEKHSAVCSLIPNP